MKIRVSDYIASFLADRGVDAIFLLSGGGMMHMLDAVSLEPRLKYICHHHEQAASMAADAYARIKNDIGVCLATSGPGGPNALTGVLGSWCDSTPLLLLTGQAKLANTVRYSRITGLRQHGAYDVDVISITSSITKYAVMVEEPEKILYHLEKAFYIAKSGRPGPVHIDVPLDIQGALIDPCSLVGYKAPFSVQLSPSDDEINAVIGRLSSSARPVLLVGHGVRVAGAAAEFQRLAEKLDIPVVTSQFATDLLPEDHPLFVGRVGTKGDRAGNLAVQNADLILSLGFSFHELSTGYEAKFFAPGAFKIQVDLDPAVLMRTRVHVELKIRAELTLFMSGLNENVPSTFLDCDTWKRTCIAWKRKLPVSREPHKKYDDSVNFYYLMHVINKLSEVGDIFVADSGSAWYVVSQALETKRNQRIILSGGLGTMGYAVPATSGACIASGGGRVICITGDGSLQTSVHELAVWRQNDLNAKLFVANNSGYASIRNTQNSYFDGNLAGVDAKSGVYMPSLSSIASAYGIPFFRVQRPEDLHKTVDIVLAMQGPVLCEVITPAIQEIIPSVATIRHEDGRMESKPLHEMFPPMDLKEFDYAEELT